MSTCLLSASNRRGPAHRHKEEHLSFCLILPDIDGFNKNGCEDTL